MQKLIQFIFYFLIVNLFATNPMLGNNSIESKVNSIIQSNIPVVTNLSIDSELPAKDSVVIVHHPKRTAAILALTLGMLGVHRLYLGCKPWVPVFYVLTVGGVFFILPLIDLVFIMKSRDISEYYNNNSILMWMKK